MSGVWVSGYGACFLCGHEWIAVFHIESENLQCPKCKTMTGRPVEND